MWPGGDSSGKDRAKFRARVIVELVNTDLLLSGLTIVGAGKRASDALARMPKRMSGERVQLLQDVAREAAVVQVIAGQLEATRGEQGTFLSTIWALEALSKARLELTLKERREAQAQTDRQLDAELDKAERASARPAREG